MHWFYLFTGILFTLILLGFGITSLLERERRAGLVVIISALFFLAFWLLLGTFLTRETFILAVLFWVLFLLGVLVFALPFGRPQPLLIDPDRTARFDERHIMFGRAELTEGSPQYEKYYGELNPGMKETDDHIRAMPELGREGPKYYHPLDSPYMVSVFEFIEKYRHLAEPGEPVDGPVELTPEEATRRLKGFAGHLGVLDVRVTRLRDYHVYSHAGRHLHNWGREIPLQHKYGVVFSVEMDHRMVHAAPLPPASTETAIEYMRIANIAICLSTYIKNLGYPARAHLDGNYQVLATAVAHDAGLGELGRLGLIITPSHGPRVRTAVVTSDIPLVEDPPINFGVQHFCEICRKCATNCPSGSIATGDKIEVRGVTKWQSRMESCYKLWRSVGTDCSLCLAVCPYSKPDTIYHRIMRFFIRKNPLARKLAFVMDDLLYGKKPRHTDKPPWFSAE